MGGALKGSAKGLSPVGYIDEVGCERSAEDELWVRLWPGVDFEPPSQSGT